MGRFDRLFLHTSKYSQNMRRLSCKIFNDFYVPELPKKDLDYGRGVPQVTNWVTKWYQDLRTVERNMERPGDLDPFKNPRYYPSHPQISQLTNTVREYGLFVDEHRDFTEAMKMINLSRGKFFRKVGGSGKKIDTKKKKKR